MYWYNNISGYHVNGKSDVNMTYERQCTNRAGRVGGVGQGNIRWIALKLLYININIVRVSELQNRFLTNAILT